MGEAVGVDYFMGKDIGFELELGIGLNLAVGRNRHGPNSRVSKRKAEVVFLENVFGQEFHGYRYFSRVNSL